MNQTLIPVLVLATIAVSSSNVIPISVNQFNKETVDLNGQYNDNTFSNKYKTRDLTDIYKLYMTQENKPTMDKLQIIYADMNNLNNRDADILGIFNKNENYNGEGFRKEQWHNYPRQLDRLHQVYEQDIGKRNYDTDLSKEQYSEEVASESPDVNDSNDLQLKSNAGTNNIYETIIPANPLFILKIGLACLNKNMDNADIPYYNLITSEIESNNLADANNNEQMIDENPAVNVMKVKREGISSTQNSESTDKPANQNKSVNKRIFSLWSRLQSLNHKGHELQHRRHLHAFYGLPDSDSGGTLTAETRATLMRPPGSPLRWG